MHEPTRVVVIGIGGTGTWLTHGLVRSLEFHAPGSMLFLIDGDTFEDKNAERQSFSRLGNKALVFRQDIAPLFQNVMIIAKAAWVVEEDTVGVSDLETEDEEGSVKITPSQILQEGDHVFCMVDNHATRKIVFDAAKELNDIDIYTGGNDESLSGSIYHYVRRNGVDVTTHPSVFHDEFVNPPDKNPGSMSCEERAKLDGGTQILAANMTVAAMLLAKFSESVLGDEKQQKASLKVTEVFFDMAAGLAQPYDWRVDPSEEPSEEAEVGTETEAELTTATSA